jgi:hypothetical protein
MQRLSAVQNRISISTVERWIYLIRGLKIMLDQDLADLYKVEPRALIQALKRNIDRFPEDFMFQLSSKEAQAMRSQTVIASRRNVRYLPYAFTEQGVAMLSSVLRSKRAVLVNIAIMRAFVKVREIVAVHGDLAQKLEKLEKKFVRHDQQLKVVFDALRRLVTPPPVPHRKVGFLAQVADKTSACADPNRESAAQ